ncbi:hypothetical protein OPV22_012083 [Ensete ventricosum]|uniref:Uncharacterized protein n=1 Tax=Ensete ventricosum TaxID=4639 RepID=A0AAV8R6A9_ENSVE|nr:hypothetical protein OPV22_012083 [Ensete ventricosum]
MGADPPSQTTASRGGAADACIWFVSILFFLLLLAGGAMLVLYMVLPETSTTMWFPAAGMILVGIPWAFWIMTCFYRSFSIKPAQKCGGHQVFHHFEGTDARDGDVRRVAVVEDCCSVEVVGGVCRRLQFEDGGGSNNSAAVREGERERVFDSEQSCARWIHRPTTVPSTPVVVESLKSDDLTGGTGQPGNCCGVIDTTQASTVSRIYNDVNCDPQVEEKMSLSSALSWLRFWFSDESSGERCHLCGLAFC